MPADLPETNSPRDVSRSKAAMDGIDEHTGPGDHASHALILDTARKVTGWPHAITADDALKSFCVVSLLGANGHTCTYYPVRRTTYADMAHDMRLLSAAGKRYAQCTHCDGKGLEPPLLFPTKDPCCECGGAGMVTHRNVRLTGINEVGKTEVVDVAVTAARSDGAAGMNPTMPRINGVWTEPDTSPTEPHSDGAALYASWLSRHPTLGAK